MNPFWSRSSDTTPSKSMPVLPALGALGVSRLDLAVASHADLDDHGGLAAVLCAVPSHASGFRPRVSASGSRGRTARARCGLGFEIVFVAPLLARLRRKRRAAYLSDPTPLGPNAATGAGAPAPRHPGARQQRARRRRGHRPRAGTRRPGTGSRHRSDPRSSTRVVPRRARPGRAGMVPCARRSGSRRTVGKGPCAARRAPGRARHPAWPPRSRRAGRSWLRVSTATSSQALGNRIQGFGARSTRVRPVISGHPWMMMRALRD
jgi:hypothetical protein